MRDSRNLRKIRRRIRLQYIEYLHNEKFAPVSTSSCPEMCGKRQAADRPIMSCILRHHSGRHRTSNLSVQISRLATSSAQFFWSTAGSRSTRALLMYAWRARMRDCASRLSRVSFCDVGRDDARCLSVPRQTPLSKRSELQTEQRPLGGLRRFQFPCWI